jgi:hypothetical protein
MAINGIKTAREAEVVAGELDRISTNGAMILLMLSTDPEMRPALGAAANILKGLTDFSKDLKEAARGLESNAEVFPTVGMEMSEIEAKNAVDKLVEDLKP